MYTQWDKPTKYIVGVGLALLGLYLLYISRTVLPLLIIAALIAFIVRPIINFLHRRLHVPMGISVLMAYLLVLIIVLISPLFLIPPIVDAVNFVRQLDYQEVIQSSLDWVRNTLVAAQEVVIPIEPVDTYVDNTIDSVLGTLENAEPAITPDPLSVSDIVSSLGSALTITFGVAADLVGNVLSSVVLLIFILLSSIYMSLSAHTFQGHFLSIVPEPYRPEIVTLLSRMGNIWVAFFRGQVVLMVLIGVIVWVGLTILGVPGALSLGIVAGLLEIVPNLGPVLATVPAVIVALLQGSTHLAVNNVILALIVIGFYVLVQQLENSIIVPKVLGDAVELPPLTVMIGVLVGATVGGILGALLATPIVASGREVVQYLYRKILGENPFPPVDEDVATAEPAPSEKRKMVSAFIQRFMVRRASATPAPQSPSGQPSEEES